MELNKKEDAKRRQQEAKKRWLERNPNWRNEYYRRNRDAIRAKVNAWRTANRERLKKYENSRNAALRQEALDVYGRACVCCGETREPFLTLDHFVDDKGRYRKTWRATITVRGHGEYGRLKTLGWPPIVRTLCMNCNWGRRHNKICPHDLERQARASNGS